MSTGRVIVATWEPHETIVLETIRDLGLELQVIFNKGAVMVLPAGVNKATGLAAALEQLGLSRPQRRGHRRCGERSRAAALVRVLGRGGERLAEAERGRGHRHAPRSRRGCCGADRCAAGG